VLGSGKNLIADPPWSALIRRDQDSLLLLYVNHRLVLLSALGIFAVFADGDGLAIFSQSDGAAAG